MSTTSTTPQWAIEAAKEIHQQNTHWLEDRATLNEPTLAAIIAKHAPSPAAQPTDEAKLREVIFDVLREPGFWGLSMHDCANRMTAALAPHLSQREPGDSDGEVLRGKLMSAGDLTLLEDQNAIEETGVFVKCTREALRALSGNLVYEEVEIRKSAQRGRGEDKP